MQAILSIGNIFVIQSSLEIRDEKKLVLFLSIFLCLVSLGHTQNVRVIDNKVTIKSVTNITDWVLEDSLSVFSY